MIGELKTVSGMGSTVEGCGNGGTESREQEPEGNSRGGGSPRPD